MAGRKHKHMGVGRQGEFLAAFILEGSGVEVHHVDRQDADLWCRVGDRLVTVQVKTASRAVAYASQSIRYHFYTPPAHVDYYCFVCLDVRLLLLRAPRLIRANQTRLRPSEVTEENQRKTIDEFIDSC